MSRQTPYYPLGGGLDAVTPIVQIPDGRLAGGSNFEPWINGGYRRILGFERFDGRPAPSEAEFRQADITMVDPNTLAVGDSVTGDVSGATAVVAAIDAGRYALTKINGTFQVEAINGGTGNITDYLENVEVAPTVELEESWGLAAEEQYRPDIQVVPGTNAVRGCWQNRADVYAIRDNVGETAGILHKASASGWTTSGITMTHTVRFDAGTGLWAQGEVVTGGTSGAAGTVHRVIRFGGSTVNNDEYGYLALTGVTGTFQDNEALTGDGTGAATASSDSEEFALPVGGRYSFITHNFLAGANTYRVYGCQGLGPAFEIDENSVVTPILLDLTFDDAPTENNPYLVQEFDGALWLMFPGGSLQKSVTGEPLVFNGFLGAAEFGLSDEGTGLINSAGRVLVTFTRRQTFGIFPTDTSYQKRAISDRSGGILYSSLELDSVLAVDDSGLIDVQRSEAFGDYANATVSDLVQPLFVLNRDRIIGTQGIRESNQYRVLFDNGAGIIMRRRPDGIGEFATFNYQLNNEELTAAYTCEDENSAPTYWMCGTTGYVYRCERGKNFDGEEIESFIALPFNHQRSPAALKRYRLAEVEIRAERVVRLLMSQDRDFGDREIGANSWNDALLGGGGFYDLDSWGATYWDEQVHNYARFELRGSGRNTSLLIYHKSNVTRPFILQGVILHFDMRRGTR